MSSPEGHSFTNPVYPTAFFPLQFAHTIINCLKKSSQTLNSHYSLPPPSHTSDETKHLFLLHSLCRLLLFLLPSCTSNDTNSLFLNRKVFITLHLFSHTSGDTNSLPSSRGLFNNILSPFLCPTYPQHHLTVFHSSPRNACFSNPK